jgi:hypothetical protein
MKKILGLFMVSLVLGYHSANAASLDTAFKFLKIDPQKQAKQSKNLPTDLVQPSAKNSLNDFDIESRFADINLNLKQREILQREQDRIDRLYVNALKDGAIDEWESLLLQRMRDHALKLLESSASL